MKDTYTDQGHSNENLIIRILQYGLKKPGSLAGDKVIKLVNGSNYGTGIYTSKIPLYSQLYAPMTSWEGKYFQTILMVRQKSDSIDTQEGEGTYSTSLLGNTNIHKLYKGKISSDEMQYVCFDENPVRPPGSVNGPGSDPIEIRP
ncbi:15359_t:CDS:2, partial [Racocetra fulgida]